ncbi:MAG TPA: outer membrane beta-barrel protein [Acidobacteriaceae bacterium]|jgi:opacity protein-like surface antigen|nr:outer membrane beta-barrel protein [Acidobacteriaceae bacterium]
MKKTMLLLGVLMLSAAAACAQESRQDISISGTAIIGPTIHGADNVQQSMTGAAGALLSYRYMLTPRSALEMNYSWGQDQQKYFVNNFSYRIHSRQQEVSAAYVYSMTFKRYNPFVELGVGTMIFTPILDNRTLQLNTKSTKGVGGLGGGGLAYELSPSWDIRMEYRAFLTKTPSFGQDNLKTNRYEVISIPSVGVAFHF